MYTSFLLIQHTFALCIHLSGSRIKWTTILGSGPHQANSHMIFNQCKLLFILIYMADSLQPPQLQYRPCYIDLTYLKYTVFMFIKIYCQNICIISDKKKINEVCKNFPISYLQLAKYNMMPLVYRQFINSPCWADISQLLLQAKVWQIVINIIVNILLH